MRLNTRYINSTGVTSSNFSPIVLFPPFSSLFHCHHSHRCFTAIILMVQQSPVTPAVYLWNGNHLQHQQCICAAAITRNTSNVSVVQQSPATPAMYLWYSNHPQHQQCTCGTAITRYSNHPQHQQCICGVAIIHNTSSYVCTELLQKVQRERIHEDSIKRTFITIITIPVCS